LPAARNQKATQKLCDIIPPKADGNSFQSGPRIQKKKIRVIRVKIGLKVFPAQPE
jgi:hypothetical protein